MSTTIANTATFPVSGTYPTEYLAAAANPVLSGNFIPAIWSGKLIEKFYNATVLAAIANTDYQGEIRAQGDKVIIRTRPTITINTYSAEQDLAFERPTSNVVELVIDKGYYFATILDDVLETQMDLNLMSIWADDASEQMKIKIDSAVLASIAAGVSADNAGDTAGVISNNINLGTTAAPLTIVPRAPGAGEVEVIDAIMRMAQVLDEQNIPETGRWMVIPAWMAAVIKRSELRDASLSGDGTTMLRNGRLGVIDRFTLYASNLLPVGTGGDAGKYTVFAGHSHGLTFASQMAKMETLRAERTFGNIMRGLQIAGWKVVDGKAIATMIAKAA